MALPGQPRPPIRPARLPGNSPTTHEAIVKKLYSHAFIAALALSLLLPHAHAQAQAAPAATAAIIEKDGDGKTLDELYQAALKEGGRLTVYAGGDEVTQGFGIRAGFEKRFPGLKLDIVVDLSKYHDARIDEELARKQLKADVAHLQTLHDFDYWKRAGVLLPYKPIGWDQVPEGYKDPQGAFTGLFLLTFANTYNRNLVNEQDAPRDFADFLKPEFKGRIIITYPHDDDAVLYGFDKIVRKYGLEFIDKLKAQDVQWVRGTQTPRDAVEQGKYAVSTGTSGSFVPAPGTNARFVLPASDPFATWAQTGAIFKDAPHPASARLYMSWMLSLPVQSNPRQFPLRKDVPPQAGYKPLSEYNTSPADFLAFMRDRARVERARSLFERLIGPVQGISPLKD